MTEEELKNVIKELQKVDFDLNWKIGNVITHLNLELEKLKKEIELLKKQSK